MVNLKLPLVLTVLSLVVVTFILAGAGCSDEPKEVVTTSPTPTVTTTPTATKTPTPTVTPTPTTTVSAGDTPDVVVANFLNSVLGTLPTSELDYEKAKTYMEAEYGAGLDDPSFIPMTLCIQDGPTDVSVDQPDISGDEATVMVSAYYGEWSEMWNFTLIREDGEWLISNITCVVN